MCKAVMKFCMQAKAIDLGAQMACFLLNAAGTGLSQDQAGMNTGFTKQ